MKSQFLLRTKKQIQLILALLFALSFALLWAFRIATTGPSLRTWSPPADTPSNGAWTVEVRQKAKSAWIPLFVHAVKVGHQEPSEPLAKTVGLAYRDAVNASLVKLDFDGEAEFRATFQRGDVKEFVLSPASYHIPVQRDGRTFLFTVSQDIRAPRKIVLRVNGNWEEDCLHLITNPVEKDAPSENDAGVLAIEPGEEIPRVLPAGKRTYYFKPGLHRLPQGAWVELDLGAMQHLDRFDLESGPVRKFLVPGGQNYRIEYRERKEDTWRTACENRNNARLDLRGERFPAISARYVRLILLGNTTTNRSTGFNYLDANYLTAFRLYAEGSDKDVAEGHAVDGAMAGFQAVTRKGNTSLCGNEWSGESFFVTRPGTTLYLAPGAVVQGAIAGEGLADVSIRGRGILDAGVLVHNPSSLYREGRTSAIHLEHMDNVRVEGISVLDSPKWNIVLNKSRNAVVRQVDIFGSTVNADGIHMSAVTHGLVEGCFLRSCDDLFCMYHYGPGKDVTVRNCVCWTDGGRAVLLGLGATPGDIEGVNIENLDILNIQNVWNMEEHGGALQIWATGNNTIHNVRFRDIRLEPCRFPSIASVLQVKAAGMKSGSFGPGHVEDIRFDNLSVSGSWNFQSYIQGTSTGFEVSNIVFQNARWESSVLTGDAHGQVEVRSFVHDVKFLK